MDISGLQGGPPLYSRLRGKLLTYKISKAEQSRLDGRFAWRADRRSSRVSLAVYAWRADLGRLAHFSFKP